MSDILKVEFTPCHKYSKYEGKFTLEVILEKPEFGYDFIVEPTFIKDILEPGDVVINCIYTNTDTITKSNGSITFKYVESPRITLPLEDFMAYLLLD